MSVTFLRDSNEEHVLPPALDRFSSSAVRAGPARASCRRLEDESIDSTAFVEALAAQESAHRSRTIRQFETEAGGRLVEQASTSETVAGSRVSSGGAADDASSSDEEAWQALDDTATKSAFFSC